MATKRSSSGSGSDLNIGVIPASIVAGIIAWFLGSILYSAMLDSIPRPVVIGIVFTVLYLFILIAVVLVSVIQRQFQGNAVTLLISFLAGALVVFLLAALFQFIYGLDFKTNISGPSSYVFIIDEFTDIIIDTEELSDYKWIDIKEIDNIPNCSNIVLKMKKYLN